MAAPGSGKGRLIYADDFNDPTSGWPNESTRPMRDGRIYQRAYIGGLYRIDVKFEGWIYTAPKRSPPASLLVSSGVVCSVTDPKPLDN